MTIEEFAEKYDYQRVPHKPNKWSPNDHEWYPKHGGYVYTPVKFEHLFALFNEGKGCLVCGWPDINERTHQHLYPREDARQKRCFNCNFWEKKCEEYPLRPEVVIVNGVHYSIAPDQPPGDRRWSGFGGDEFKIRFTAGRRRGEEVVSHNVWHQGRVPSYFRDRLTDNAEFL